MADSPHTLGDAFQSYQKGNLPQAELICRNILRIRPDVAPAYLLLGLISATVGAYKFSRKYLEHSLRLDPGNPAAKTALQQTNKAEKTDDKKRRLISRRLGASHRSSANTPKFLLIKAWGSGFWSDMDHVLGQLLLAEMTGRTPVIHWGSNSLFRDPDDDNAFDLYFEPVSSYSIDDLAQWSYSYFPPKWRRGNLRNNDLNKWSGPYSRMAGLYFLMRDEDVLVSDFHTYLYDLVPWIPQGHPLFGWDPQRLYRYLVKKYIKTKSLISGEIEEFWSTRMSGKNVLAAHVRGSDKLVESPELYEVNKAYHEIINNYLMHNPTSYIFLLTDSLEILSEYQYRYPERLIYTDCTRTDGKTGVHYQNLSSGRKLGLEIIRDTYLAARCNYFIGNGRSNVSSTILHLKEWSSEQYFMLSDNMLFEPHLFLHEW